LEPPCRSASYFLAGAVVPVVLLSVAALFSFFAAAASMLKGYFFYALVPAFEGLSNFEVEVVDSGTFLTTVYVFCSFILGVSFFLSSYTNSMP
jgi:hypothetical protein